MYESSIKTMHRKGGDLVIINDLAVCGMIIRHLILPENLAGSDRIILLIAENISRNS
jgi:putative pyruvate formate lyase activating enzyme